jgi:predicted phage gp36 major capsid-like protein
LRDEVAESQLRVQKLASKLKKVKEESRTQQEMLREALDNVTSELHRTQHEKDVQQRNFEKKIQQLEERIKELCGIQHVVTLHA